MAETGHGFHQNLSFPFLTAMSVDFQIKMYNSRQCFSEWEQTGFQDVIYLHSLLQENAWLIILTWVSNFFFLVDKNNSFEANKDTMLKKSVLFPGCIFIYNTHIISDRYLKREIYIWYFKINFTFSGARAQRWSIYHCFGSSKSFFFSLF